LLDPFRAEKIERKLRKSIAFARVRRKRGRERVKFFFSSFLDSKGEEARRERERRRATEERKKEEEKKI